MSFAVVVNPNKVGDVRVAREHLNSISAELGEPAPAWFETSAQDPGPGQTRQAVKDGATTVLGWGGDGTLMAVAAELANTDVALGLIPGGTGNLLARNLDVPLAFANAVRTAYRGRDRRIDLIDVYLGQGQRRVSSVMCGMGWDAAMMAAPEALKKHLGWGAYAIEGARRFRQKPMRLRLSVDGGPEQHIFGRTVLIANVGTLVAGLKLLPESEPDDGFLEVLVIDPSSPLDWVRTTTGILRGKGSDSDPSRTLIRGRDVVVTTPSSRERQIDGDLVSNGHGFHARVMPQSLTVRVPL